VSAADHEKALWKLTDREREVLVLAGEGRTNAEIAEIAGSLYVSEGAVKTHINHLFAKLHLRDRTAAVIFAYEDRLVGGQSS
jgi:DNA-binding NarL/FixJ family response regulator